MIGPTPCVCYATSISQLACMLRSILIHRKRKMDERVEIGELPWQGRACKSKTNRKQVSLYSFLSIFNFLSKNCMTRADSSVQQNKSHPVIQPTYVACEQCTIHAEFAVKRRLMYSCTHACCLSMVSNT